MDCVLCSLFGHGNGQQAIPQDCGPGECQPCPFPAPVIYAYRAPGNRNPPLTDATYDRRPGTPSNGARNFAEPINPSNQIGPTDYLNPFPRSAAEGQRIRWVNEQWTIVGGPACTAPNQPGWGWVHNYGYITIADTLKPAQQLPRYNAAAVDTETVLQRARSSVLRALYGR